MQKQEELLVLGDQPKHLKCPYCMNQTVSNVTFKNGYTSYIMSFFFLLLFGILPSFLFIPVVMLLTKQLIHRCSVCGVEIGTDGKIFYALGLKDTMLTCKIGEFGCILTRKLFIGVITLILTILLLVYRVQSIPEYAMQGYHHHTEPLMLITDTWEEFLKSCNHQNFMESKEMHTYCLNKYTDRTVQMWKGYVIRIEDLRGSILKYLHHAVTIQVKMDPSESEFYPDLILTLDSEYADKLGDTIEKLNRGSQFGFNAIIKNLGDAKTTRHLHMQQIWLEDGYIDIPPHQHQNSRYSDTPSFLKGK